MKLLKGAFQCGWWLMGGTDCYRSQLWLAKSQWRANMSSLGNDRLPMSFGYHYLILSIYSISPLNRPVWRGFPMTMIAEVDMDDVWEATGPWSSRFGELFFELDIEIFWVLQEWCCAATSGELMPNTQHILYIYKPRQNNPYKKGGLKLLTKQKTNGIL